MACLIGAKRFVPGPELKDTVALCACIIKEIGMAQGKIRIVVPCRQSLAKGYPHIRQRISFPDYNGYGVTEKAIHGNRFPGSVQVSSIMTPEASAEVLMSRVIRK
jgi:hypothetical protein